ncbi:MAG: hypothetical protein JO317_06695 [Verrucomicrobiae bacterium]|nr:hypothetical protein [Verrucomicrobiae bacterium]
MPVATKSLTKRYPPRPPQDVYRFSSEELAEDRDFQQEIVRLSSSRDAKVLGTTLEVKSPLGPFVVPCFFEHSREGPAILVSQSRPWEPAYIKHFFSYVCRVRTTPQYMHVPIVHVQKNLPAEVDFLSSVSPAPLLAVDARAFYRNQVSEDESALSTYAEDFSKILRHHSEFEVSFRPEVLGHLDHMIEKWFVEPGHDYPSLGALKNMLGFFYGEIFVRNHLGRWLVRVSDGDVRTFWIETPHSRYNVIGKVWKAFRYGPKDESLEKTFETARTELAV